MVHLYIFFFEMITRPPESTLTDTLFPVTTLLRSPHPRATSSPRRFSTIPPSPRFLPGSGEGSWTRNVIQRGRMNPGRVRNRQAELAYRPIRNSFVPPTASQERRYATLARRGRSEAGGGGTARHDRQIGRAWGRERVCDDV